ncbi:DHA2 family efflux MFS transporter permease subunit [Deinococcus yavapaiensis]|uniref:EmrB/QacA subfamily drug resistance transporter n=1 Tax=Deinococcus yavapaiensis KR-236 TaxID=694435 RepID=A0A318S246_9DEIO|nr:DHA2 family efflux MFS transporter permease subunit [Deinococcus yavapaiensis]PYE49017.1 EmrB/QacA subfamily drug resistance transporter [Deinococcus yavapaiensis KR-236]
MSTPTTLSDAPPAPEFSRQEKVFTLVGTLLGLLLAALDQTIVATAGPQIQKVLNIDTSLYTWITTAYLVASTVMVPIYGKLSDLYGRKAVLLFGVITFLAGSFLCGAAGEPFFGSLFGGGAGQLIAFRALQGFGSAALFTTAFAVISDLFSPAERGRYSGLFGAVFGLSSVLGPLIGGFLTDHLSWRWVFYVNLPVGALALFFIITRMPALRHLYTGSEERPRIDFVGAFLLAVAVIPLLLALTLGKSQVAEGQTGFLWTSWQILAMFGTALVGTAAFLYTERRAHDPIIPLKFFKNRVFSIGSLAGFVLGMAFLGPIVFLPLFMVNVVGLSATNSGLTITPLALALVASNVISGQLVSRLGKYKPIMIGALLLLIVGFLVMAFTLTTDASQASVTFKMILVGLGLGPSIPLYTLAVQNAMDPRQTGAVTSSITFFRSLGQVVGVAILGTVFANTLSAGLDATKAKVEAELPSGARGGLTFGGGTTGGEGASSTNFDLEKLKSDARRKLEDQKRDLTLAVRDEDPAAVKRLLANDSTPKKLRDLLTKGGVAASVHASLQEQKEVVVKALRDNDPASVKKLLASDRTPKQLRDVLEAGGVAASVNAGFDRIFKSVEEAVTSGNPARLSALAQNPQLPEALRQNLAGLPARTISTSQGRQAVLSQIRGNLDVARESAVRNARQVAVQNALSGIDKVEETTVEQVKASIVREASDSITAAEPKVFRALEDLGAGVKTAFTDSVTRVFRVGIFIVVLGFLVTLLLPQLPLRKRGQGGPPALE